jgi:hypothetical protein
MNISQTKQISLLEMIKNHKKDIPNFIILHKSF